MMSNTAFSRHAAIHQGMTLVEILAVVVILGLLAVTLTVGITAKMGKAKQEICKMQIAQIVGQIQVFQMERRGLPQSGTGLSALSADPKSSWYLEPAKLTDPWGAAYNYLIPGPEGQAFEVLSYGADGQPGGAGDAADVSSAHLGQ
jgi:general secretion pathway protein G